MANGIRNFFYLFYVFLWFPYYVRPVRITGLDVPKTAWDTVTLNCRYVLEDNEQLYVVKWYKDDVEFFRCLANGTNVAFPQQDISIYQSGMSQFGSCYFDLVSLTEKSGGEYKCEVSLDGPTFGIAEDSAWLTVQYPKTRQVIEQRSSQTEVATAELPRPLPTNGNTRIASLDIMLIILVFSGMCCSLMIL